MTDAFLQDLNFLDYDGVAHHIREGQDVNDFTYDIRSGNEIAPLRLVVIQEPYPHDRDGRINKFKIIQLLVQNGADLEYKWKTKYLETFTYLLYAVDRCDTELVKLLLDLGADPNHAAIGCSPLEYALSENRRYYPPTYDVDLAELLLMYGADPQQVRFDEYIRGHERGPITTFANLPDHLQNLIDRYNELIRTGAMGEINNLRGPDPQKTFIHRAIQRAMALDNEEGFDDFTPENDEINIRNIFEEAKMLQPWSPEKNKYFLPSFRRRVFTSMLQAQREPKDYTQLPPELYLKILIISSEPKDVDVSTLQSFIRRPAIVFGGQEEL